MTNPEIEMYIAFRNELDKMAFSTIKTRAQITGTYRRIEFEGEPVGFIIVLDGYIYALYVDPKYRRKGLAKKAIYQCIADGVKLETLHVIKQNKEALVFWKSIFNISEVEENFVDVLYRINSIKTGGSIDND